MPDSMQSVVQDAASAAVQDAKAVNLHPGQAPGAVPASPAPVSQATTVELPEFMQGQVDAAEFAKLPVEQQTKMVEWGKSVYGNAQQKTEDAARVRKEMEPMLKLQEDLQADPKLASHLKQSMADFKAGRTASPTGQPQLSAKLEGLVATAPAEEREEQRRNMHLLAEGIQEQLGLGSIQDGMKRIEEQLQGITSASQVSRRDTLTMELSALPKSYQPLVEKHREATLRMGSAPSGRGFTAEKLLQIIAEPEEYKSVLRATPQTAPQQTQRLKAHSTTAPVQATTQETLVQESDVVQPKSPHYGKQIKIGNIIQKLLPGIRQEMPPPGV